MFFSCLVSSVLEIDAICVVKMNAMSFDIDDAFTRSFLYNVCRDSTILRNMNYEKVETPTLRALVNKNSDLEMRQLPILLGKRATKIALGYLVEKFPHTKSFLSPDRISVKLEDNELSSLLENIADDRPKNLLWTCVQNIAKDALNLSVKNITEDLLRTDRNIRTASESIAKDNVTDSDDDRYTSKLKMNVGSVKFPSGKDLHESIGRKSEQIRPDNSSKYKNLKIYSSDLLDMKRTMNESSANSNVTSSDDETSVSKKAINADTLVVSEQNEKEPCLGIKRKYKPISSVDSINGKNIKVSSSEKITNEPFAKEIISDYSDEYLSLKKKTKADFVGDGNLPTKKKNRFEPTSPVNSITDENLTGSDDEWHVFKRNLNASDVELTRNNDLRARNKTKYDPILLDNSISGVSKTESSSERMSQVINDDHRPHVKSMLDGQREGCEQEHKIEVHEIVPEPPYLTEPRYFTSLFDTMPISPLSKSPPSDCSILESENIYDDVNDDFGEEVDETTRGKTGDENELDKDMTPLSKDDTPVSIEGSFEEHDHTPLPNIGRRMEFTSTATMPESNSFNAAKERAPFDSVNLHQPKPMKNVDVNEFLAMVANTNLNALNNRQNTIHNLNDDILEDIHGIEIRNHDIQSNHSIAKVNEEGREECNQIGLETLKSNLTTEPNKVAFNDEATRRGGIQKSLQGEKNSEDEFDFSSD